MGLVVGVDCRFASWRQIEVHSLPLLTPEIHDSLHIQLHSTRASAQPVNSADHLVQCQKTSLATNQAQPLIAFQLALSSFSHFNRTVTLRFFMDLWKDGDWNVLRDRGHFDWY